MRLSSGQSRPRTSKSAILGDPAFAGGEYDRQPLDGLHQMRLMYDSWVLSQDFYRQGLHLAGGFRDTQAYLDRPVDPLERRTESGSDADTIPSKPIALPIRSLGTISPTSATVSAIVVAAPSP